MTSPPPAHDEQVSMTASSPVPQLADLADRPLSEHIEVYEALHRGLQADLQAAQDEIDGV